MLIAIDWDRTITADPTCFMRVIDEFAKGGHEFIVVTGRKEHDRIGLVDPRWKIRLPKAVIYANGKLKRKAAEEAGYKVDIWIDDEPGTIEPCRILEW